MSTYKTYYFWGSLQQHVFFEIFWIVIVTGISTQFSVLLYEESNNLKIIKFNHYRIFKQISLGYLILIIGVLIEFYVTNKF
ncbi:stage II sporulation protein M [Hydrotalea flava]|uniref:stage II sporulation protein M n=1 Tax=Hydrotalea flava TaxID=714549 RepID=UPI0008355B63